MIYARRFGGQIIYKKSGDYRRRLTDKPFLKTLSVSALTPFETKTYRLVCSFIPSLQLEAIPTLQHPHNAV